MDEAPAFQSALLPCFLTQIALPEKSTILAAYIFFAAAFTVYGQQPLAVGGRVKAQEAIERVSYAHRVWPKENPSPMPPFEQVVTRVSLEARVADSLQKSAALEALWQRPIAPAQLQAEMDRMARDTKDPALLSELFAALNNDPDLIAECLARPLLADRLIRTWYASDSRFHSEARAVAESTHRTATPSNFSSLTVGELIKTRFTLAQEGRTTGTEFASHTRRQGETLVAPEQWERIKRRLPAEGKIGPVEERDDAFLIYFCCSRDEQSIEVQCRVFRKVDFDTWWRTAARSISPDTIASKEIGATYTLPPIASPNSQGCGGYWEPSALENAVDGRENHSAVWTGTEMIIWGGDYGGSQTCYQTGARYTPATDTWLSTSTGPGCPQGRVHHTAIWTGTEMIVWGGDQQALSFDDGGRYNPSTDQWTLIPSGASSPEARSLHTAVWTGTEMVIWGGDHQMVWSHTILNTGGRFDPRTGTWMATSTGANNPGFSSWHVAVWTGTQMVIWGNNGWPGGNIGGRYNPINDTWLPLPQTGGPSPRVGETAIWTGTEMVVWGGDWGPGNTGARYSPSSDTWVPTSTGSNCPSGRRGHTAVWTGSEMVIWGADSSAGNTGGRYYPATDSWLPTSTGGACPRRRNGHTAVWTGSEVIVWGGYHQDATTLVGILENTGGRYMPSSDDWVPTSTGAPGRPFEPNRAAAVWTGSEMVLTGMASGWPGSWLGARYSLATDSWSTVSEAPGSAYGRIGHTVIWTGSEMLLWGGGSPAWGWAAAGGRYDPLTDTWTPLSTAPPCPTFLDVYVTAYGAVWTGGELVVWGWDMDGGRGARYSPLTDSWTALSPPPQSFPQRRMFTSVWTGSEMLLWGGQLTDSSGTTLFNSGVAYSPATNRWRLLSVGADTPSPRSSHTAVWTGSEMVVWGGQSADPSATESTGGRYNPSLDRWAATSTGPGCPLGRMLHSAVWSGTEMIVWGGQSYSTLPPWVDSGGRYNPVTDAWVSMGHTPHTPSARCAHLAVWTGSRMIVYGGEPWTSTGGVHVPELITPTIAGPDRGCEALNLSTSWYPSYQWNLNGGAIPGAMDRTFTASQSGTYSVTVSDGASCTATSAGKTVTIAPPPAATVSGPRFNRCPASEVALTAAPPGMAYQWNFAGAPIAGATAQAYGASLSGDYSVTVANELGCSDTSPPLTVLVVPCSTTEVSPAFAVFPARLVKDPASPTGYYLYFQKVLRPFGYNLYEGTIGAWYSHGSGPGRICGLTATDLGTGEMRAALSPSEGNHYYLVTTFQKMGEGPSGFDSDGVQIPPALSTCPP